MANRKERRAAEAKARKEFSKEDLMRNWRETQESLMAMRALYRETLTELQQLRGKALNTQMVLLGILYQAGPVDIDLATVEEIEAGVLEGWTSDVEDSVITVRPVFSENFEDDAE